MSIRKIRKTWWVDFRYNRTRYRRRSPENSKSGAKAYESLLISKLIKGKPIDENNHKQRVPNFEEYAKGWLATYVRNNNKPSEQYKKNSILQRHLIPFFGDHQMDKITHRKIEEYKAIKFGEQKPKTTNNQLAVLSKCLRCAYEEFDIEVKFPKIILNKIVDQQIKFLSVEESQRLIQYADGFWKNMILVALKTGVRLGELLALDWDDVNFATKTLTIRRSMYRGTVGATKNYKVRVVSMTDDVFRVLANRKSKTGFVFVDEKDKPLNHDRANRNIHRICKVANVQDVTWHILRHTFASHLAMAGVSMRIIQDLLGHSGERMTRRYAHLSPHTFESAINNLNLPNFNLLFDGHYMGNNAKNRLKQKSESMI